MPPRFPYRREPPPRIEHRINERIRVPRIKLIDETGAMMGEVPTEQARQMARERGYDLVEISGEQRPPICKLLDYGKWKYENKKKLKKSKQKQHVQQVKEVRMRPRTEEHDMLTKVRKAREFLLDGDKILVTIFFRGREMAHKELGRTLIGKIKEELADVSKVEHDTMMTGQRMQILLLPKPGKKPKESKGAKKEKEAKEPKEAKETKEVSAVKEVKEAKPKAADGPEGSVAAPAQK